MLSQRSISGDMHFSSPGQGERDLNTYNSIAGRYRAVAQVQGSLTTPSLPVSPGKTRFKSIESQREEKNVPPASYTTPSLGTALASPFLQLQVGRTGRENLHIFSTPPPSLSACLLAICSLSGPRKFDFQLLNTPRLSSHPIYLWRRYLIILSQRLHPIVSLHYTCPTSVSLCFYPCKMF
jgi:hypothetical protein